MQRLIQDLRYAFRMVLKNPAPSVVVVLSLALGIGANTAIFTLINAAMLKSLPVENPAQLVLFNDSPSEGEASGDQTGHWRIFSHPLYSYFQNDRQFFQDLCAFRSGEDRLSVRIQDAQTGEPAHEASGHLVSGNYFGVMGVNAILGQVFTSQDDSKQARPVAVISYAYWKQKFDRDPSIVGRVVFINGTAFTIVGVTPPQFLACASDVLPIFGYRLIFSRR